MPPSDSNSDFVTFQLTNGTDAYLSPEDSDLAAFRWTLNVSRSGNTYVYRWDKTKTVYMHRIIGARIAGHELERKEEVDHADNNGLNNQRNNLRVTTRVNNNYNAKRPSSNKSGYKGVFKVSNRWRARIGVGYRGVHLGYFATPEEAYEAYCKALVTYAGEFARFE